MATVRQLKLAANAGEPDSVLARRIDVVAAAVAWYDAIPYYGKTGHPRCWEVMDMEDRLEKAVRRYKGALKHRRSASNGT